MANNRSRLDQNQAPIYEALEQFRRMRVVPFDVPGHKRGRGNPELAAFLGQQCVGVDVNSMKPLDNLCHPVSVIREAEDLAADAFGAAHAFLMVGGTTSSVQSMVLAACKRGDEIILPRNVHRSVINALVLCGAVPVYVNPETDARLGIGLETYSPYQNADLTDFDIFDSGDLELCFGSAESALNDIESRAAEILRDNKLPLLLGGEHLVTLGAVRAVLRRFPDLHIVHFDAHADLRQHYLGAQLSHACVLRRCHDLLGDGRIHQFCIRSGEREEFAFAAAHTDLHPFDFDGLPALAHWLRQTDVPVYLTIDLDCLDPGVFPGTGTPEAGGVSFVQLLDAIRQVCTARVVRADVNELAPMLDPSGASTATACKVVRELLLALCTHHS